MGSTHKKKIKKKERRRTQKIKIHKKKWCLIKGKNSAIFNPEGIIK